MHVLSIDIDYAYSPGIEMYDDHIIGSRITVTEQKKINRDLNLPPPKLNSEKLKYIKNIYFLMQTKKDTSNLMKKNGNIIKTLIKMLY